MAHITQKTKKELAPGIKAVLKKYGIKGTIAIKHHSTLVMNIRKGALDIIGNYNDNLSTDQQPREHGYLNVNHYHIETCYTGEVQEFLTELKYAMCVGNYDRSDTMTDYFNVGWYLEINVGVYGKPYLILE